MCLFEELFMESGRQGHRLIQEEGDLVPSASTRLLARGSMFDGRRGFTDISQ